MDNLENRERKIEKEKNLESLEIDFKAEAIVEKEQLNQKDSFLEKSSIPEPKKQVAGSEKNARLNPIISKKMKYFLDLAEEKGLPEAIKAIKKEEDSLLLDSFHDALAKESFFKELLTKKKKPKIKS